MLLSSGGVIVPDRAFSLDCTGPRSDDPVGVLSGEGLWA